MIPFTGTLDLTEPGGNLCTNPSAVTNTTGWTNAGPLATFERSTSPPAGAPAATAFHCVGDHDADHARDEIAVESGKTYQFAASVYLDTATATGVMLQITDAANNDKGLSTLLSTLDAWTRLDVSTTADATGTWRFKVRQIGAGGTDFYFTDVRISGPVPRVGSVRGFHVAETAGAQATVRLRNGGANGDVFVQVKLEANRSHHVSAKRPMLVPRGLFIDVTGAVRGSIQPG